MTVKDLIAKCNLKVLGDSTIPDKEIVSAYSGDLLSDVMGNAPMGSAWITIQTHVNVAAVASLRDMAAIIIANGRIPEAETISRCNDEKIALLGSDEHAFILSGKLYQLLINS